MDKAELKHRTKQFALRVLKLAAALPNTPTVWTIRSQLIDSGTSVGSNYRAACRARSRAEFVAKLGVVVEETDESAFWMELIMEAGLMERRLVEPLHAEASELVAIMVASRKSCMSKMPPVNRKSKI